MPGGLSLSCSCGTARAEEAVAARYVWCWGMAGASGALVLALCGSAGFLSLPLCCSEEDEGSWLPARSADCVDGQPPESKIRSL